MINYLSRHRLKIKMFVTCIMVLINLVFGQTLKEYQAENADFYHAKIETEHAGFTGDGYVNFDNETGSYIEFSVFMAETDTQTVYIFYANGGTSARPMNVALDTVSVDAVPAFQPTGAWTSWKQDSIRVFLQEGANKLRFISSISDGGPNVDKIEVSGNPGTVSYELTVTTIGSGRVDIDPAGPLFEEGSTVQLTAIPDSGWNFLEWRGDTNSTLNPFSVVVNSNMHIAALFVTELDSNYKCENEPIGFATVDTLGQNGTYGGAGGDTVIVTTGAELFTILDERRDPDFDENHPPVVIIVRGKLTWTDKEMMDFKENYDVSLIGEGTDAQIEGFGLNLFRSHNIIIRNIEFRNAPDDCMNITDPLSHHIWVDHCTFSDDPVSDPSGNDHDGLLDIKHGASFITVSWCHFYNHRKSNLLGHSETNTDEDTGRLKVSYHHNWWDNTGSRNPRTRFGEVHVYNNFYDNSEGTMLYGVGVTCYAQVFVEANYFQSVALPVLISQVNDPEETLSGNPEGYIMAVNNYLVDSDEIVENVSGYQFDPRHYYDYQPDNPAALPSLLRTWAGSGKIDLLTPLKIIDGQQPVPAVFSLLQNYPNPFNPDTRIAYTINEPGRIRLAVFDLTGRQVVQLVDNFQPAGYYVQNFNATGLTSGVYFYRLEYAGKTLTRKMMVLK